MNDWMQRCFVKLIYVELIKLTNRELSLKENLCWNSEECLKPTTERYVKFISSVLWFKDKPNQREDNKSCPTIKIFEGDETVFNSVWTTHVDISSNKRELSLCNLIKGLKVIKKFIE